MHQTAWIPSKHAVVGKYIRILGVDGWRVDSVGQELDSSYVAERSRDYRHTREASDI